MAMVTDAELLSDEDLLAELAALMGSGSRDCIGEATTDAHEVGPKANEVGSTRSTWCQNAKRSRNSESKTEGEVATSQKAALLKAATPGRKRAKLKAATPESCLAESCLAESCYSRLTEEFRRSRAGKSDYAVGPRWHLNPKVTWTEQPTPASKSLPRCAGGKPVQPCYPPPAHLFLEGIWKIIENARHWDARQEEDWLPRVRDCPKCGEGDRYENYCICNRHSN